MKSSTNILFLFQFLLKLTALNKRSTFSFILLSIVFGSSVYAGMWSPIVISYEDSEEEALVYDELLKKKYNIPKDLIRLKEVRDCSEVKTEGKLCFCIKKEGDIVVVSIDQLFVDESLQVFKSNEN